MMEKEAKDSRKSTDIKGKILLIKPRDSKTSRVYLLMPRKEMPKTAFLARSTLKNLIKPPRLMMNFKI
jgi:hypothetical protein